MKVREARRLAHENGFGWALEVVTTDPIVPPELHIVVAHLSPRECDALDLLGVTLWWSWWQSGFGDGVAARRRLDMVGDDEDG